MINALVILLLFDLLSLSVVLLQLLRDVASELDGLIQDVTTGSSTTSDGVTYTLQAPSTCENNDLTSSDETIRQSSSPSSPETPKLVTSQSIEAMSQSVEATSHVREMTSEVSVFMSKSSAKMSENFAVTSSTTVVTSHSMTAHSFKTDISSLPVSKLPLVEEEDEEDLDQLIFQLK